MATSAAPSSGGHGASRHAATWIARRSRLRLTPATATVAPQTAGRGAAGTATLHSASPAVRPLTRRRLRWSRPPRGIARATPRLQPARRPRPRRAPPRPRPRRPSRRQARRHAPSSTTRMTSSTTGCAWLRRSPGNAVTQASRATATRTAAASHARPRSHRPRRSRPRRRPRRTRL